MIITFPTSVVADTFDTDTLNLQDQRYAVLLYSVPAMFLSATGSGRGSISPILGLVAIAAMIADRAVTTEGVRPRTRSGRRRTVETGDTTH